jgi:hypothetical protein
MNTKGNDLDEIAERLVDAVLADHILQRDKLIPRVRAIIQAWVKVNDRPADYNTIKTDKGILQKTIEQRGVEKEFWRNAMKENFGADKMQIYYEHLNKILVDGGFKEENKKV